MGGRVEHAGLQHSEQEDQGGVEHRAFRLRCRPGEDFGFGDGFFSSSRRCASFSSSSCSGRLEEGGGGRDAMHWRSPTVWGFNGDGAAAAGSGGLSAGFFDSSSVGLGTGVGGSTMGGAPVSPPSLSAASIAPRSGARTGAGRLSLKRAPESPTSLSRVACGTRMAPVSPATVSAANIAPRPGANQPRSSLAMPKFIPMCAVPAPLTTGTSGGVGGNRSAVTFVHEDLNHPWSLRATDSRRLKLSACRPAYRRGGDEKASYVNKPNPATGVGRINPGKA